MNVLRSGVEGPVDLLELQSAAPERYPFLLQSVSAHARTGRYDLLFAFPGAHLQVDSAGVLSQHEVVLDSPDFFAALDEWIARDARSAQQAGALPFSGGWFVYLSYEAAALVEPNLRLPMNSADLPLALAVRCPAALIYDRLERRCHLVAEDQPERIEQMRADLAAAGTEPAAVNGVLASGVEEDDPAQFLAGVDRVHEYLRAGDVFQVNLSRQWRAALRAEVGPDALYRRLRQTNPAPFSGCMRWAGEAILSSSPERLVKVHGRSVQTRPIAGTRPKRDGGQADARQRQALIASLKERAEHVMLIDLERNDLGRVCEPGSVLVSELMTIESYAHVHHIVSNVQGRLRRGVGAGQVLRALFPGGTITGCPKLRCMQIIAELEGVARGPYTGSMGYVSRDGGMDSNILIRTFRWRRGEAVLRAGAGIVADSDPQHELAETRAKARGLLLALGGHD